MNLFLFCLGGKYKTNNFPESINIYSQIDYSLLNSKENDNLQVPIVQKRGCRLFNTIDRYRFGIYLTSCLFFIARIIYGGKYVGYLNLFNNRSKFYFFL